MSEETVQPGAPAVIDTGVVHTPHIPVGYVHPVTLPYSLPANAAPELVAEAVNAAHVDAPIEATVIHGAVTVEPLPNPIIPATAVQPAPDPEQK